VNVASSACQSMPATIARSSAEEVVVDLNVRPSSHGTIRDQFTLWFGLNAVVFSVALGGVPVLLGLNFLWSTIAIVVGVVIGRHGGVPYALMCELSDLAGMGRISCLVGARRAPDSAARAARWWVQRGCVWLTGVPRPLASGSPG
jgi:hypothetical protein